MKNRLLGVWALRSLRDRTVDEVDEVLLRDRAASRSPSAVTDDGGVDVVAEAGPRRNGSELDGV